MHAYVRRGGDTRPSMVEARGLLGYHNTATPTPATLMDIPSVKTGQPLFLISPSQGVVGLL